MQQPKGIKKLSAPFPKALKKNPLTVKRYT